MGSRSPPKAAAEWPLWLRQRASARFKCSRSPRQTRRRRASLLRSHRCTVCTRWFGCRCGATLGTSSRSRMQIQPPNARCLECSRTTRTSRPFFSTWNSQVLALILKAEPVLSITVVCYVMFCNSFNAVAALKQHQQRTSRRAALTIASAIIAGLCYLAPARCFCARFSKRTTWASRISTSSTPPVSIDMLPASLRSPRLLNTSSSLWCRSRRSLRNRPTRPQRPARRLVGRRK